MRKTDLKRKFDLAYKLINGDDIKKIYDDAKIDTEGYFYIVFDYFTYKKNKLGYGNLLYSKKYNRRLQEKTFFIIYNKKHYIISNDEAYSNNGYIRLTPNKANFKKI